MKKKLRIQDIYDTLPEAGNYPGDIWHDLPFHGLLGSGNGTGIVISPACDLTNNKASTITYLPVVSVRSYFSTIHSLPVTKSRIKEHLESIGAGSLIEWPIHSFTPLSDASIYKLESRLNDFAPSSLDKRKTEIISRIRFGLDVLRSVNVGEPSDVDALILEGLFGPKQWNEIKTKIIRNSFSLDIHFMPHDCQEDGWSAVPQHSLVLFRCPVSVPSEILDLAQDSGLQDWNHVVNSNMAAVPIISSFRHIRPTKRATLKSRFMADLTTRYISLYARLGSPDFTVASVSKIAEEIG